MKCVKCGAELEEGKKFCGNCGNPVESVDSIQTEETPVNEVEDTTFTSEVSNEPQQERQEIVQEPIPVDTNEFKEAQKEAKKNSGAVKYILIILIVLALVAGGIFAYFKFFAKESYSKSVDNMEKAVNNLINKTDESGTIKAKIEMAIKDSLSLDFAVSAEYEKNDNNFKMHIKLDKNIVTDQIDLYGEMDKNNIVVYIPSSLVTLIDDSIDFGTGEYWLKYSMPLDELGIDFSDLDRKDASEELDLSKVLVEENFKYIGKKDGLKQYTLTIDKDYLNKFKDELKDVEDLSVDVFDELGNMTFDVNFYVNGKDFLEKIELDMKNIGKEVNVEFTKLLFTLEFSGFNTTKVEIPANVKLDSIDLNQYVEEEQELLPEVQPTTTQLF